MYDTESSNAKKNTSFWDSITGLIVKITALIIAITGLVIAIKSFSKSKLDNPINGNKQDIVLAEKKDGQLSYNDPKTGQYKVVWRRLSLIYDGSNLEYDVDVNLNFPGCPGCISQVLLWVDNDHCECIYEGSANNNLKSLHGSIAVPRTLTNGSQLGVNMNKANNRFLVAQ